MDPQLRGSLSAKMAPEQVEHLREVFHMFDTDKSGSISASEVEKVLAQLGYTHITTQSLRDFLKTVDKNEDGIISFDEFVSFMILNSGMGKDAATKELSDDQLRVAFRIYDVDHDGFVTPAELRAVVASTGDTIPDEDIANMIKQADTDGDGRVSFDEFRTLLRS